MSTEQSNHWEEYKDSSGFIDEGFPFEEGFPEVGPLDDAVYEIIFRSGERMRATVDFSTQYRAEGIQWREIETGKRYQEHVIPAWRRVQHIS